MCSAIVDRLIRGESICEDEVFDDVSCVNDAVEQLFDLLAVDDVTTLTKLHTLISNRLPIDHHRSVRAEDEDEDGHGHDEDDHGHDEDTENVNVLCLCVCVSVCVCVCVWLSVSVCICVDNMFACTCLRVHVSVSMCTCVFVCLSLCVWVHACVCVVVSMMLC